MASAANNQLMEATDVELAIRALAAGADPNYENAQGMRPLLVCCGGAGPIEMVDLLLKAGARVGDADKTGWTALHFAASSGQEGIVTRLIAAGAPLNAATMDRGWTPLTRATYRACPHIIKLLIASGADTSLTTEVRVSLMCWRGCGLHAMPVMCAG